MAKPNFFSTTHSVLISWLIIGWVGNFILPWYAFNDGFFQFDWLSTKYFFEPESAPAFFYVFLGEKQWISPISIFLIIPLIALKRPKTDPLFSRVLVLCGGLGLAWMIAEGFSIGINGWSFSFLEKLFGPLEAGQYGMGYGALFTAISFLFLLTTGLAAKGFIYGDVFVVSSIGLVISLVIIFVIFPIFSMFIFGFITEENSYSFILFFQKITSSRLWSLDCLFGGTKCGVAWNSLFMAVSVASITTFLGLIFALTITRTGIKFKGMLKALSVLPIITPPFVIGLALILLFGLSGSVTVFFSNLLGIEPTRWLYGLPGIIISQTLAYTPIVFLVLIGVVENVSPDMEEAAQTLRASRWQTFKTITFPLIRPGLANAFLLGFIESLADFGNPLVLGGNFDVLSTEIFFSIVGAQYDQGGAAVLAIVLLIFTLVAFYLQKFWLSKKSYTTITGKSSSSIHPSLPSKLSTLIITIAILWFVFTIIIYGMIIYGSFVDVWGIKDNLTFKHYLTAFKISFGEHGLLWEGSAWNSFWATLMVATISAPLTAAIGLLTAWLLSRKSFPGKNIFEFGTMLSFAIPGTVIGVSYLLSFNIPPIEITGTGIILILCFVFRNMPVGVRSGIASMSQIDKSLDESSLTLGANSFQTFIKVTLPLLRPAILAALVFSFVRAFTAISAVIFLVSAEYNLATSYIIGRVENNEYGLAIAYSTSLIVVLLLVVLLMQQVVGKVKLGKR